MVLASLVLHTWMAVGETQHVSWQVSESCPSVDEVLALTATVLGRELDEVRASIELDARIHEVVGGQRLQLRLSVDGIDEQHELWALDCVRLSEDVAFLLASAIDPFVMWQAPGERRELGLPPIQRPRARAQQGEAPAPLAAVPPPDEPQAAPLEPTIDDDNHGFGGFGPLTLASEADRDERQPRQPRGPLTGTLGASAASFVGLFPNLGGGVQIEGGIERGLWRWRLGAEGWFGGRFRTGANVGTDLLAVSGSTGVCAVPHLRRVRFEICGLGGAGGLQATPVNTTASDPVVRPWAFLGGDMRVNWTPRPGVGLYLGVSVLPALARPVWSISNPETIHVTPPVTGVLRMGVELRAAPGERA